MSAKVHGISVDTELSNRNNSTNEPFSDISKCDEDNIESDKATVISTPLPLYSEEYLNEIINRCATLGVCVEHQDDLITLVHKLRKSEDVVISDLCSDAGVNRKMWWNESTPLMIACLEGSHTLVQVLLLLGADVSAQNKLGNTGNSYTCWVKIVSCVVSLSSHLS